jgi:gamma-glutamylcyclotransferase
MYYFAYASNLSHKHMLQLCPDCKPKFTATLHNYKLIFTGWSRTWRGGVATIRASRSSRVMGGVYEISDRCLRLLDGQEEYPAVSDRINVSVTTKDGNLVDAVTYFKREQSQETEPSKEYLAVISEGYKDWRLV